MIIELPPQTAQIIQQGADMQGMSIEQFIINSAYHKALEVMPNTWCISDNEAELLNRLASDETPPNDELTALLVLSQNMTKENNRVY